MKLKKSFVLLPAMLLTLVACNDSNAGCSTSSSSSSVEPQVVEVLKTFSVALNPATGTTLELETAAKEDGKFEAGSTISVKASVTETNLVLDKVTINGKAIAASEPGKYEFVMPNADAVVATSTTSLGSMDIVNVSNVDEENLPETAEEVYELLKLAKEANQKYLVYGTYQTNSEASSTIKYSQEAKVGLNDVMMMNTVTYTNLSDDLAKFTNEEFGLYEGVYYELTTTTSGTTSAGATIKGNMYKVAADETENLAPYQIKAADAHAKVTTGSLIDHVMSRAFSEKSSESFIANPNSAQWVNVTVDTTVDASKKAYTVTLNAVWIDTYKRTVELELTFDGDNFLTGAEFNYIEYNTSDWDAETNQPFEDAEPKSVKEFSLMQERGFRSNLAKTDVAKYVATDYDINLSYKMPNTSSSIRVTDGKVEASGTLSYTVRQRDNNPVIFKPILLGSKETDFVTFDGTNAVINQFGNFTLLFDNGLGLLKEMPLESVQPLPASITAILPGNKLYVGYSNVLSVSVNPSAANQAVTVELSDSSSCDVTIVDNGNGTFTINGNTAGSGTLIVTSVEKPSITTSVSFTVLEEKPDVNAIKLFLTSTTLFGKLSGWGGHFFNFYEDGTGEYVCYESGKGNVIEFEWALNENAVVIEITKADYTLKSKYYTLGKFFDLTESSFTYELGYSGNHIVTITALDTRIDFATANLSDY